LRFFNAVGIICYNIRLSGIRVNVEAAHFSGIERPRAAAAEDSELVAGLVDGAVTINTLRNG
jgi:hypothetical protein